MDDQNQARFLMRNFKSLSILCINLIALVCAWYVITDELTLKECILYCFASAGVCFVIMGIAYLVHGFRNRIL